MILGCLLYTQLVLSVLRIKGLLHELLVRHAVWIFFMVIVAILLVEPVLDCRNLSLLLVKPRHSGSYRWIR